MCTNQIQLLGQGDLNKFVRDLGLSKQNAEILGSLLNERNVLHQSTTFYWYRKREEDLKVYFVKEGSLVYCNDIRNLIIKMGI